MVRQDAAALALERQNMLVRLAAKMAPCPTRRLLLAFRRRTGLTELKATGYLMFLAENGDIDWLDGEDTVYMPGQRPKGGGD